MDTKGISRDQAEVMNARAPQSLMMYVASSVVSALAVRCSNWIPWKAMAAPASVASSRTRRSCMGYS